MMELQFLNSILKNLEYPNAKVLKRITQVSVRTPIPEDGDGSQGDENEFDIVYQSVEKPEIYIKVSCFTDSYGSGSYIRGVQFVQPQEKTITVYQ